MRISIFNKSNLKLIVFGLFWRFVRTLIIKICPSQEPTNITSIHRVRNVGKLITIFYPLQKLLHRGVERDTRRPTHKHSACACAINSLRYTYKIYETHSGVTLRLDTPTIWLATALSCWPSFSVSKELFPSEPLKPKHSFHEYRVGQFQDCFSES